MKFPELLLNSFFRRVFFVYFSLVLVVYLTINIYNDNVFTYSLDDPYIHLSLAQNLASGNYGIQPGEYASASSTILFPFLLVPFSFLSIYSLTPFLFNTLATALSLIILFRIYTEFIDPQIDSRDKWLFIISIFWCNPIGLIFTGMEHSLQVCVAIITFYHINRYIRFGTSQGILIFLSILNPLIRYEGFALVAGIILIFLMKKEYLMAFLAALCSLIIPFLFSLYLHSLNLPYLPYSIIKKGEISSELNLPKYIYRNVILIFYSTFGRYLAPFYIFGLILLIALALKKSENRLLALFTITVIVLHFSFGKFGAYGRYEVYAGIILWMSLLLILHVRIKSILHCNLFQTTFSLLLFFLPVVPYIMTAVTTPIAAHNIYRQQYQMSRFHKDYFSHRVAVNDIGLVTFHSKNYVMDLFGISSGLAQKLKLDSTSTLLDSITKVKQIRFAMIYKSWFPHLPRNWVYAGDLKITSKVVFIGSNVGFFLIDKSLKTQFKESLKKFVTSLPKGTEFLFNPAF